MKVRVCFELLNYSHDEGIKDRIYDFIECAGDKEDMTFEMPLMPRFMWSYVYRKLIFHYEDRIIDLMDSSGRLMVLEYIPCAKVTTVDGVKTEILGVRMLLFSYDIGFFEVFIYLKDAKEK